MKNAIFLLLVISTFSVTANSRASEGLISIESKYTVTQTADRFETLLNKKGFTVFSRINHSKNASSVDLKLGEAQVIIFGKPKVGTLLMQCAPQVAIDLPQKALFWQDANNKVWLSYNQPSYLKSRHKVKGCDAVFNKIDAVLNKLSTLVVSKDIKQ